LESEVLVGVISGTITIVLFLKDATIEKLSVGIDRAFRSHDHYARY